MNGSKVYIIIVTFNGMQWLPECLESTKPYPTIIVDNNSQDGTIEYIERYHPEVTLLKQNTNIGFGKGNNIGISYAVEENADFVFLLNQDAFLYPNTIPNLLKLFSNHPGYGILSPIHLNRKGDALESVFSYYLHKSNDNGLLSDLLIGSETKEVYPVTMVNAAAWLISRETLYTVGGFQPLFFLYGEDDNYVQRINYHGLKIGICPGAYIRHDSNSTYHLYPEKDTEKYYGKFLNRIKIDYADVNNDNYLKIRDLRKFYLKKAIASLIQMDWKTFKINLRKQNILKSLNFNKEVEQDRLQGTHYLDIRNS